MHTLINKLHQLAKESHDRQVIRHSIGLAKRLQELNPQDDD